jgi:hypothetical protein
VEAFRAKQCQGQIILAMLASGQLKLEARGLGWLKIYGSVPIKGRNHLLSQAQTNV